MSFRYNVAKKALASAGYKNLYSLSAEDMVNQVEAFNKKRKFKVPNDGKCEYSDIPVMEGKYHCLSMQKNKEHSEKAILYLYGGGLVLGPDESDISTAKDFGRDCGQDVWFPYYPLCVNICVLDAYEMVFDTYKKMINVYGAENITVLGFFSGAMLAIGLGLYNNAQGKILPMPRRIIAVSPLCCPENEDQYDEMLRLNDKDIMMEARFTKTIRELMRAGIEIPEYMYCGPKGNFSGMPEINFWYGEDEVLSAMADAFADACKAADVPYTMTIGEGMCHCYPQVTFFPEGKAAREKVCGQIKK